MIVNDGPTHSGVLRGELWGVCVCVIVESMEGEEDEVVGCGRRERG